MLRFACDIQVILEANLRVVVQTIASGYQYYNALQASPNWRLLKSKRVKQSQTIHLYGWAFVNSNSSRRNVLASPVYNTERPFDVLAQANYA